MEQAHHHERTKPHNVNLLKIIPPEQRKLFDPKVLEEARKVKIHEYSSNNPGDLIFITGGAHGEETRGSTAIDMVEKNLPKIEKGTVVFIPEMNPSGCHNKTRWVFDDEKKTNINNEYHYFVNGEWDELSKISDNKTAQLSWLIMHYLKQRTAQQIEINPQSKSMLIDIHREESVPFIRVDRRFTDREDESEDPNKIAELLNLYHSFGLPIVLEKGENWQEEKFYQSLTATCIRNNILGVTIEEGNTHRPESENTKFLQNKLLTFLKLQGFIPKLAMEDINLTTVLQYAEKLWNIQQKTREVYSLTGGINPEFLFTDGSSGDPNELLKKAFGMPIWDGFFSQFPHLIRGSILNKEQKIKLSDISLGYVNSFDKNDEITDIALFLQPSEELWLIDVTEPKTKGSTKHSQYGFFEDPNDNKIKLRTIGETIGGVRYIKQSALKPDELRRLYKEGKKFDMNILNVYCAHLDPVWKGIDIGGGQISLQERS